MYRTIVRLALACVASLALIAGFTTYADAATAPRVATGAAPRAAGDCSQEASNVALGRRIVARRTAQANGAAKVVKRKQTKLDEAKRSHPKSHKQKQAKKRKAKRQLRTAQAN